MTHFAVEPFKLCTSRDPTLYHCLLCCSALLCIVFYFFRYLCIFLVSICANIGSTITNHLIMNIIIQIPEGALLTCMPHTSSTSSQILLSQRAQEAKSLGARPPFKSACLRGEKSRVPLTQPPSFAFPLQPPSSALAASPPSSSPSTHAQPGLRYLHYLSKSCRFCSSQGHHSKLLIAMF